MQICKIKQRTRTACDRLLQSRLEDTFHKTGASQWFSYYRSHEQFVITLNIAVWGCYLEVVFCMCVWIKGCVI